MNTKPEATMIDGREALLTYVGTLHPRMEIAVTDLMPGGRYELPSGFSVTENPHGLSILNPDPWRSILFGPLSDYGVPLMLRQGHRGPFVLGLDLAMALMVLVRQGPPVWAKNQSVMMEYIAAQIRQCAVFQVVASGGPQTREQMGAHVDTCPACKPSFSLLIEAVNNGSSRTSDADLRELIEKSHSDPEASRKFYQSLRDTQWGVLSSEKPQRTQKKGQEVNA